MTAAMYRQGCRKSDWEPSEAHSMAFIQSFREYKQLKGRNTIVIERPHMVQ
jgi:hypothetical protein